MAGGSERRAEQLRGVDVIVDQEPARTSGVAITALASRLALPRAAARAVASACATRVRGHDYLGGARVSAVDIYLATLLFDRHLAWPIEL